MAACRNGRPRARRPPDVDRVAGQTAEVLKSGVSARGWAEWRESAADWPEKASAAYWSGRMSFGASLRAGSSRQATQGAAGGGCRKTSRARPCRPPFRLSIPLPRRGRAADALGIGPAPGSRRGQARKILLQRGMSSAIPHKWGYGAAKAQRIVPKSRPPTSRSTTTVICNA